MKRWIPSREQLRQNRWLRPVARHLDDDRLWHATRASVARAVAIGLFFGHRLLDGSADRDATIGIARFVDFARSAPCWPPRRFSLFGRLGGALLSRRLCPPATIVATIEESQSSRPTLV